jgi:hypothetical protein
MIRVCCPKHKKYTAVKPPRASCVACVTLYELRLSLIMSKVLTIKP